MLPIQEQARSRPSALGGSVDQTLGAVPVRMPFGDLSMKIREIITKIEADGWHHVRTRGSHQQYKHPTKPGRVTVAGKPSHDLPPGTLNSIL